MRTVVVVSTLLCLSSPLARGEGDLFTDRIRPILARHCLKCHGPDDKARKGDLRLDVRADALAPAASGDPAIVAGDPDASELLARIVSDDPNEVMPPPSTKNPLNDEQKRLLREWIASGAEYREHWAFIPPRAIEPPPVGSGDRPLAPIDRFVQARLAKEGLEPMPEAERAVLLRRVSLDLIGLPPTPEETKAFLEDTSTNAYEKVVDRLLHSPHYGERWARKWLDLARYADTNGYEKDRPRSIWPYRDWLIKALNDDMSFSRFTIEQIAGDMLPDAGVDQLVATGFHRNTMLNEEGGIDPLEFRWYAMNDRTTTTGTTWLGLTLLCAQCHTHKYDPIPHADYYRFQALMDNADEPEIALPSPDREKRLAEIEREVERLAEELPDRFPAIADDPAPATPPRDDSVRRRAGFDRGFAAWLESRSHDARRWKTLLPKRASSEVPQLVDEGAGVIFVRGDQTKRDVYTIELDPAAAAGATAISLTALADDRLPKGGPGRVYYEGPHGDFFLSEFRIRAGDRPLRIVSATQSFAGNGAAGAGAAIDGDPQTGWTVNGGQGRSHAAVFVLEKPIDGNSPVTVELVFERYHAAGLGKFRLAATTDPRPPIAASHAPDVQAALAADPAKRSKPQFELLRRTYALEAPELAEARKAIEALRRSAPAATTTLVMRERPASNRRATHVRHRGEWLQPKEQVEPAVPSILPQLPSDAPADRLALARWLASPANPLSGRVTVNRAWAAFFGTGIVRTTEDFGYQGDSPSHPELLDHLAVEFMKTGSFKQLHKSIVMSATYRQDSAASPAALAKDPQNRLLSRGPRVRLDAETLRDQALAVSGLLSPRIGGPSVFPPQPPGITTEGAFGAFAWKVSTGGDQYRRGLYTFTKRTTPYAMFNTFDAPSGEYCLSRREVSNTPLQALMLLNDPVFDEAARALGRSAADQPGDDAARIERLFEHCLTRRPTAEECSAMLGFLETQRGRLRSGELDATKLSGSEGSKVEKAAAIERAAWSTLSRAILNLDEMVTKG
ncbi:MAG: PSD1 and planctomycete cytochrome C domain-containing protein [Isosphaeraceae bacterium]|nr:PSD1 and planctomycete cytochrome C domain-containing protein [Isosphaeraceae bacterium]